jgi:hypothetical protein
MKETSDVTKTPHAPLPVKMRVPIGIVILLLAPFVQREWLSPFLTSMFGEFIRSGASRP